jgi:DNA-binding transcriptional LysR family regulator
MDLLDLRYVSKAAEALNISRAAEILGLNASTISRRITRLEDELGVTLFERGHHGLRLTDAGKLIMIHVDRALDDLEHLVRAGQQSGKGLVGSIRLGVRLPPIGEPLRTLLAAWRGESPQVSLNLHETNDQELRAAMFEHRLDVAIIPEHSLWPGVVSNPIFTERLFAAFSTNHRLHSRRALTWALLREETVLVEEWAGSHTTLEFYASLIGSGAQFVTHSASKQSVLALVAAGFGVTLVTASQAMVLVPGVAFAPIEETNAFLRTHVAWTPEREEPALGRFVAFLRDEARSHGLC